VLDEIRPLWREFRGAPWRRELLAEMIDIIQSRRAAGHEPGLFDRFLAVELRRHLQSLQESAVDVPLLAMQVEVRRLGADEALAYMSTTPGDGFDQLLVLVWRRLSRPALREALRRLHWDWGVRWWTADECGAALREAARDGWTGPARALVREAPEPRRSELWVGLLPVLAGAERAEVLAAIFDHLVALAEPLAQVGLVRALLPQCTPAEVAGLTSALAIPGGSRPDLQAWVRPGLEAAWDELDALADPRPMLETWQAWLTALGPLVTLVDSRRWLRALHRALALGDEALSALAVALPAELWGEALAPLTRSLAAEARLWLAVNEPGRAVDSALAACPAHSDVLRAVMRCAAEPLRGVVAMELLRRRTADDFDEMEACLRLTAVDHTARVERALRDEPLLNRRVQFGPHLEVLVALTRSLAAVEREHLTTRAWRLVPPCEAARCAQRFGIELAPDATLAVAVQQEAERAAERRRRQIARALESRDPKRRWSMLAQVLRDGEPDALRDLYREVQAGDAALPDEILGLRTWWLDAEMGRAWLAAAENRIDRAQIAMMRLQQVRLAAGDERAACFERALDELTATGATIDSFDLAAVAPSLTAPQIRRALAFLPSKDPDDGDPRSLATIAMRLMDLGHFDEATALLNTGPVTALWLGVLLGIRLARGELWGDGPAGPVTTLAVGVLDDETRLAWLTHVWDGFAFANGVVRPDVSEGSLRHVAAIEDPELRARALAMTIERLPGDASPTRWAAVIDTLVDGEARLSFRLLLLWALAAGDEATALAHAAFADPAAVSLCLGDEFGLAAAERHLPPRDQEALLMRLMQAIESATEVTAFPRATIAMLVAAVQRTGGASAAAHLLVDVAEALT
jgi:hypothetical protein